MKFGKNLRCGGIGGVFDYERSRCHLMLSFRANTDLKMPFPTHVFVTLNKEGSFSCPPEEFREKMMAALKINFLEKLQEEPWSDLEATLCYEVQQIPLFKEKRMMLKLRNISDESL